MGNWQHKVIQSADNHYKIINYEDRDNITLDEAVSEIIRVCSLPYYIKGVENNPMFRRCMKDSLNIIWEDYLKCSMVDKKDESMRYHFIIPTLINRLNSVDRTIESMLKM